MTSTGNPPTDHIDRWAFARREQGEAQRIGTISPTTETAGQGVGSTRPGLRHPSDCTGRSPGDMMPRAVRACARDARSDKSLTPRSAALSQCDRRTCTPDHRCPEHRADVDPPRLGDLLDGIFGACGGAR